MVLAGTLWGWWYTIGIVAVVGVLWLASKVVPGSGEDRDRPREGLSASWWVGVGAAGMVAAVGGLIKGLWYAAIFLVPSAWAFSRARRRL